MDIHCWDILSGQAIGWSVDCCLSPTSLYEVYDGNFLPPLPNLVRLSPDEIHKYLKLPAIMNVMKLANTAKTQALQVIPTILLARYY